MGGGEVHVAGLTRALVSRGHSVYMAVRPDSPLRSPLDGVDVSWHEFTLRNSLDLTSARAIAGLVNREGIQIVHAHLGRDYLVAALACRHTPKARLIITRHHYLPLKRNLLYRWMLEDVAAVIAVSESVRTSILERMTFPPERIHVISNWIEPYWFQEADQTEARSAFNIQAKLAVACIGRITPAKGQEDFIQAAGRVVRTRQDVEFLIAGSEDDVGAPFTNHLKALSKEVGISDRVKFLGPVDNIPALLAAVDIVVVPSWDEGFSLVTLEALASSRTVLASDTGGIKDIIQDGLTGMLFTPRDSHGLSNRLLWLLSDAHLREKLASHGRIDVFNRFGRDKVIDRIESLYHDSLISDAADTTHT